MGQEEKMGQEIGRSKKGGLQLENQVIAKDGKRPVMLMLIEGLLFKGETCI